MIQFNLLPDVKIEYIKTQRLKRSVLLISSAVCAVSIVTLITLFSIVNGVQRTHMRHLETDIKKGVSELQATPDLNKILTIQNQLLALPALHDDKPVSKRVFAYIQQLTPKAASVTTLDADFAKYTITITGNADSISTINTFVDTLKFTNYTVVTEGASQQKPAFSNVVLSSFAVGKDRTTYNITLAYDKTIFDSANEVKLAVPNIISTRSETEKPGAVFDAVTKPAGQ